MKKTKVFAAYLPQFHEIEENNRFWGKGFTDWDGVKKATAHIRGQLQPRVPLKNNYYDLSDVNVLKWQAKLAKKYGIDGFNIYHYWFENGHKVLEKPAENLLSHPEINIQFFFSWDNTSWIRSWSNISGNAWAPIYDGNSKNKSPYLLKLDYGDEREWKRHFDYLLPFFKDERYFKINGKPVFAFMKETDDTILKEIQYKWNKYAVDNGFSGMYLIAGNRAFSNKIILDSRFIYQPVAIWKNRAAIAKRIKKYLKINIDKKIYNYDDVWLKILKHAKRNISKNIILGGVVRYDDTPRRGKGAKVIVGDSAKKFEKYFSKLYELCCENEKDFLLLTAWNEWGEGAYLEPDSKSKFDYLEAVKRVVESVEKEC